MVHSKTQHTQTANGAL